MGITTAFTISVVRIKDLIHNTIPIIHTQSVGTYLISNFFWLFAGLLKSTSGYIYLKVDTIEVTLQLLDNYILIVSIKTTMNQHFIRKRVFANGGQIYQQKEKKLVHCLISSDIEQMMCCCCNNT